MKSLTKVLAFTAFGTFTALTAGPAFGQAISTGTTATGGAVNLTLTGTVASAVELELNATGATSFNASTSATMPTHATATVNFGSFNTVNPTLLNGTGVRVTTGTAGAHVVADLTAVLRYSGATSGTIGLRRFAAAGAAPDVPLANLKVSTAAPAWTNSADGTQVPDSTDANYSLCSGVGACQAAVAHQLAVFVPDTQATGVFTTVVLYEGSAS